MNIIEKEYNLKLEKGHAVCLDLDGVIHNIAKVGKMEAYMMNIIKMR